MYKRSVVFFFLVVLVLGFVSAGFERFEDGEGAIQSLNAVSLGEFIESSNKLLSEDQESDLDKETNNIDYKFSVNLFSPSNMDRYEEGVDIDFKFGVEKRGSEVNLVSCTVYSKNAESLVINYLDAFFDGQKEGKTSEVLSPGNYESYVICRDGNARPWISNTVNFEVELVIEETPNSGENGDQGTVLGISSLDDQESSRRLKVNELPPIEELSSNEPKENELETPPRGLVSKITGAVIGAVGETGTLGAGIFIVILGVVVMVVYRMRYSVT